MIINEENVKPSHLILLILLACLIVGLFGYVELQPFLKKPNATGTPTQNITALPEQDTPFVTFVNPMLGNKDAPVTIIEYGDFFCSFCASIEPTISRILQEYKNRVRFVWKDFPLSNLHPLAEKAALAGRCAAEVGKFWDFRAKAFDAQDTLQGEADILDIAARLNLGTDFDTCYKTEKMKERIQADFDEGVRLGVNGVPYFFVGKARLSGAVGYERFKEAIDNELSQRK